MARMEKTFAKLQVGDVLIPDGVSPWPRTVIRAPEKTEYGDVIYRVRFDNGHEADQSSSARSRHIIERPDA